MLSEILAELDAELTPLGFSTRFGSKYLFENAAPPLLVWAPTSDQIIDPRKQDKEYNTVRTRAAQVDAHLWGLSYAQTEAMLHCVITAVNKKLPGASSIGTAQWVPEGQMQWLRYGWGCIVPIVVQIPVLNKYVELPTTPDEPAVQPAAATIVTIVEPPAGVNEAIAVIGDKEFNP